MVSQRKGKHKQQDASKKTAKQELIKKDHADLENSSKSYKYGLALLIIVAGTVGIIIIRNQKDIISFISKGKQTVNKATSEEKTEQQSKDDFIKLVTNKYDKKIRPALKKAQRYLDQHSIEKAVQEFSFLADKYKLSPLSRFGKAQALEQKAENERSNNILLQAASVYGEVADIENCPDELKKLTLKTMAEKLKFLGKYRDAVRALEKLSNMFPQDADVLNDLGMKLLESNNNQRALSVFEKALKLNPASGCAKSHIGFILKVDNRIAESIPYLEEGIHSGEEGAISGNMYFHLGDAYNRVGKPDEALRIYAEGAEKGFFLSTWQRSLYNANTKLRAQPWWTKKETGYAKDFARLEANWKTIRDEAISQLDVEGRGGFEKEAESLRDTGDWRQLNLYARGQKIHAGCQRTPKTCAVVSDMAHAIGCTRGQIKFSVMYPGTHVWPHTGPTNCRLRAHLGLVIPENVFIRAGSDRTYRSWEEGKVLVFDDSFEHEVWHNGTSFRLILIIDFWHPDIPQRERRSLSPI